MKEDELISPPVTEFELSRSGEKYDHHHRKTQGI
jgi:hypothetical protein